MKTINDLKKSNMIYLGIAPLLTGAILLCVYLILGVYPFGSRSISYYDMAQSFVPLYYHTWDVLHGTKQLYFDWNVGMGCSLTDISNAFVLFPSNLFFLFIKRENILNSMSVFLALKMMFSSWAMAYYSGKNASRSMTCVFASIAYAFCGFTLQFYTNIHFLDIVMIFPLLVLAMENLIHNGKKVGYVILLFLIFLTNQQLAFTVVIYIVLKGWLLIRNMETAKRGRAILNLVLCSIAGFLLSAFSFIPSFYQMIQSSRFGIAASKGYMDIISDISCELFEQKLFMLFGGELGIGCMIYLLVDKQRRKDARDRLVMVLLLALPICIEGINLLWHGGSYQHFPMRFAYMLSFEMINLVCFTFGKISENTDKEDKETKNGKTDYALVGSIILFSIIAIMLGVVCNQFRSYGICELMAYRGYGFIILAIASLALLLCFVRNRKLAEIIIVIVAVVQASCGAYGLIAPDNCYSVETDDAFVNIAESVYENMEHADATNRIKDMNIDLNANYGFILGESSLGCWMTGVNPYLQSEMMRMGYSANHIRVLDGCGTIFTDALLGVNRIYSKNEVNESLYVDGVSAGVGKVYRCAYTMPFGVIMNGDISGNGFEYQNQLFKSVTGLDNLLFEEVDYSDDVKRELFDESQQMYIYSVDITADDRKVLYIYSDSSYQMDGAYAFAINDKPVPIEAIGIEENYMYSISFLNGYLEMGTYNDETVNIMILTTKESLEDIHIGLLDLSCLENGIAAVNARLTGNASEEKGIIRINIENSIGGELFIPIGYSANYIIKVDGAEREYYPELNNAFVGVDIEDGSHTVEIQYVINGLGTGIVLSIAGLILFVIILISKNTELNDIANTIWKRLYDLIFVVLIFVFYIVPVIAYIGVAYIIK